MPKAKQDTGTNTPANKQKGKKVCSCCHDEKKMTDFYLDYSPMFSLDQRTPMCKDCCKKSSLNEDGTINTDKLKEVLMRCDKPFYLDDLSASKQSIKKENSFISDDEVELHGYDILTKYFTLNGARQNRAKSFSDSQAENFMHTNSNRTKSEKLEIINTYVDKKDIKPEPKQVIWTDQDNQNKNYAIEVVGYDPFDEYPEEGRKFLYNQLSPYLEDDSNVDDAYKLSQILQIIKNNYQIDTCDKKMSQLDPLKDADSIKTLSGIKNQLVQSNDKIAKENEISVKNRSDKAAGKSTLTYLMRDLREKDFDKAEADYYDQLRGVGTRWAVDMSITSIKQNGMFDENDKKEIYEMQLDLIDSLNQQVDELKEKVRLLQIDNDRLKAGVADGL